MIEKIPCLASHERTSVFINNCFLFGDGNDEVFTTGLVAIQPLDLIIKDTVIKDHIGGGIILTLCPYQDSIFQILKNKIFKCQTAGIYIEGEGTNPEIVGNEIKNCSSVGKSVYLQSKLLILSRDKTKQLRTRKCKGQSNLPS